MHPLFFGMIFILFACGFNTEIAAPNHYDFNKNQYLPDSTKFTIEQRFKVSNGYTRVKAASDSFGTYLRTLPLKPVQSKVKYYNGKEKLKSNVYISVVDQDIDPVDLQQCADAVMRLRGEWLFAQKRFADIHFNFVSDGKPRYFSAYANGNYSYSNFRKYMKYVFSYANTTSLANELISVKSIHEMQIGDVFVQKRIPYGHAVIVVDMAVNTKGEKQYILAQSYMPAQETQILVNPANTQGSPWYNVKAGEIITPEWTFNAEDLKRFP